MHNSNVPYLCLKINVFSALLCTNGPIESGVLSVRNVVFCVECDDVIGNACIDVWNVSLNFIMGIDSFTYLNRIQTCFNWFRVFASIVITEKSQNSRWKSINVKD